MKARILFLFVASLGLPLMSCGNSKDAATIYVLTPSQKASHFTQDLAAIARRHGLSADFGRSPGKSGHVYWVVQASGRWLWLWGTNVPLDPFLDPTRCGHYTEGHSDPGQYIVMVDHGLGRLGLNHVLAMIAPGGPHTLMSEISVELKASGYDVRQSPVECSPLSKEQADAEPH
jgi:hypothetical protein